VKSNTNFNLYKTFLAVYETKNMHKSADILGISRSAVQQNIKELNKQLNTKLFNSHSKGITPTQNAVLIYPKIKSAIENVALAEQDIMANNNSNVIKIAMESSLADLHIKDYITEFCNKYPEIQLEFFKRENTSVDLIIDLKCFFDNEYKTIDLFTVKGCFIASKDFLKKNKLDIGITNNELLRYKIIAYPRTWEQHRKMIGIEKNVSLIKSEGPNLTISMVKSGLGIGYMAKELVEKIKDPDIVVLNMGKDMPIDKMVCGYKSLSPTAEKFVGGLVKFCNCQRSHE